MKRILLGLVMASLLIVPLSAQNMGTRGDCDASMDLGNDVAAYIARSTACLELDGRNPDQAFADADHAVKLAPDSAEAYAARAWAQLWQRSFGQAIADVTVAITLEPDNPQWYRARSFYMLQVDDVKGSLADIEQAIVLTPDHTDLYLYRSDYLEQLGRTDDAIADMQDVIVLYPDDAALIRRLGDLYFTQDEDRLAFDTYQRFNEITSEPSPLVNARLLILERRLNNR